MSDPRSDSPENAEPEDSGEHSSPPSGETQETSSVPGSSGEPDPAGASEQPGEPDPADVAAQPGETGKAGKSGVTRRAALTGTLLGLGGFGLGAVTGSGLSAAFGGERPDDIDLDKSYPFYGQKHQGGIQTPPQLYSMYMTLNLLDGVTTKKLQTLLARWSAAVSVMQKGDPVGAVEPSSEVTPPSDTGEAYGLSPASLTVTIGLGPNVFGDKYGLSAHKPAIFADLPSLNGDALQPALTGGDLSVHACANDPQVAYHAVRNLARIGRDVVETHWTVLGFGRASAGPGQETPRNLMGFKDGTRNITTEEQYKEFVWIDGDEQPWLKGGTYQVARKIKMLIETWDTDRIGDQQTIFGRNKGEGAPLSGKREFDTPDFQAKGDDGKPLIDPTSHVALASHENNDGTMILRRGYNFTSGLDDGGKLDAGLMFIAYMKDPQQFVKLQNRLGASDLLNEYIRHIGSAVFVVPPAPEEGSYIGKELFD